MKLEVFERNSEDEELEVVESEEIEAETEAEELRRERILR